MQKSVVKIVVITIAACACAEAIGGLLFLASGTYNIAADQPHFALARWVLDTGKIRSVEFRGGGEKVPNLRDQSLVKNGLVLYRKNCQPCHGAPGVAEEQIGRGINPKPPPLSVAANNWTDSQLFWITSHGLKMSGMPGFDAELSEADRWAITAFLRRMPFLSPTEYQQLSAAADPNTNGKALEWIADGDYGFAQLKRRGDPAKGRVLLAQYGCTTCHTIAGLGSAKVGPPLTALAERQYIAGSLVNVPTNMVAWIVNPQQLKPQTAMPNLNVRSEEALHMTAYLYTSGSAKRLEALQRTATGRE